MMNTHHTYDRLASYKGTCQKVFPPPTVGAPSASKSPSALRLFLSSLAGLRSCRQDRNLNRNEVMHNPSTYCLQYNSVATGRKGFLNFNFLENFHCHWKFTKWLSKYIFPAKAREIWRSLCLWVCKCFAAHIQSFIVLFSRKRRVKSY